MIGNIEVTIEKISGNRVKLGFNASDNDIIKRKELSIIKEIIMTLQ